MRQYRRRLPHLDLPGVPVFITWRLHGSLPDERVFDPEHLNSGEAFVAFDRLLDGARSGPVYLRQPGIAALVQEQLWEVSRVRGLCALHAYVLMPNHVHLLWTPQVALADLVRYVKGPTAVRANRILGRPGEAFWQAEYFDRVARNGAEFERIRGYIEWNPVRAGIVARPEEFRWSSAYREERG